MSAIDPFFPPPARHLNRFAHLTPNSDDAPLVHSWLHSAYHSLRLSEYHAFDFRLPPVRSELPFTGADWGQLVDYWAMRWFVTPDGQTVHGLVYFSDRCEGPPQSVHGGCLSSFFDEANPALISYHRQRVPFTIELKVRFKQRVPIGGTYQFRCRATNDINGKRVNTECELLSLTNKDGTVAVAERSEEFKTYATSSASWFVNDEPQWSMQTWLPPLYKKHGLPISSRL